MSAGSSCTNAPVRLLAGTAIIFSSGLTEESVVEGSVEQTIWNFGHIGSFETRGYQNKAYTSTPVQVSGSSIYVGAKEASLPCRVLAGGEGGKKARWTH